MLSRSYVLFASYTSSVSCQHRGVQIAKDLKSSSGPKLSEFRALLDAGVPQPILDLKADVRTSTHPGLALLHCNLLSSSPCEKFRFVGDVVCGKRWSIRCGHDDMCTFIILCSCDMCTSRKWPPPGESSPSNRLLVAG